MTIDQALYDNLLKEHDAWASVANDALVKLDKAGEVLQVANDRIEVLERANHAKLDQGNLETHIKALHDDRELQEQLSEHQDASSELEPCNFSPHELYWADLIISAAPDVGRREAIAMLVRQIGDEGFDAGKVAEQAPYPYPRPEYVGDDWVPGQCPRCECRPAGPCQECIDEDREASELLDKQDEAQYPKLEACDAGYDHWYRQMTKKYPDTPRPDWNELSGDDRDAWRASFQAYSEAISNQGNDNDNH